MKKTAFFQALLLFCLLVVSWGLLLNRLREEKTSSEKDVVASEQEESTGPSADDPVELAERSVQVTAQPVTQQTVPDRWQPWINRLREVDSPEVMRTTLEALRTELFSLPPEESVRRILAFLDSGLDVRTGLAFQVGSGKQLAGAGYLRTLLLDWLHQLDPVLAADIAAESLENRGTRMFADEYVIHMRNYAAGSEVPEPARNEALKGYFRDMINDEEWIREPGSAIAEAMDVVVHTGATEFVPELSRFMAPGQPDQLRHAAALAIERLVDREPVQTLTAMLGETAGSADLAKARSGYFARLDPAIEGAGILLDTYLVSPGVSRDEAVLFLQSFPNLNQSYSHNLLSNNIPITETGGYLERFESALKQVRQWRSDPAMEDLSEPLQRVEDRLNSQLSGLPLP